MIRFIFVVSSVVATLALPAPSAAASFLVTVENPGAQTTTSTFTYSGVENFDGRTNTGWNSTTSFTSNFGTTGITGAYANVSIASADVFGGANGTGQYALARANSTAPVNYSLNLSTSNVQGINYFGFWLSAADDGNQISFYKGGNLVYNFNTADFLNEPGASYYMGNPNNGGNSSQAYGFLNFYDTNDTFDKVIFTQTTANSGYESDNHTVGRYSTTSGYTVTAVPEPASWVMMISGFLLVGSFVRKHRGAADANEAAIRS